MGLWGCGPCSGSQTAAVCCRRVHGSCLDMGNQVAGMLLCCRSSITQTAESRCRPVPSRLAEDGGHLAGMLLWILGSFTQTAAVCYRRVQSSCPSMRTALTPGSSASGRRPCARLGSVRTGWMSGRPSSPVGSRSSRTCSSAWRWECCDGQDCPIKVVATGMITSVLGRCARPACMGILADDDHRAACQEQQEELLQLI